MAKHHGDEQGQTENRNQARGANDVQNCHAVFPGGWVVVIAKEQELIDNLVADLELNFADEIRKSEAAAEKPLAEKAPEIIIPPGVSKN